MAQLVKNNMPKKAVANLNLFLVDAEFEFKLSESFPSPIRVTTNLANQPLVISEKITVLKYG